MLSKDTPTGYAHPPLGERLRAFLQGDEEIFAKHFSSQYHFEHLLLTCLQKKKVLDQSDLTDLMAELVELDLPLFALKLQTLNAEVFSPNTFHSLHVKAAAQMLNGDFASAKQTFAAAHRLSPDEVSVHINMTKILRAEGNSAYRAWLEQGLQIEPNAAKLWLLAAHSLADAQLWSLVEQTSSWLGAGVYQQKYGEHAEVIKIYRQAYACGERTDLFLISYTGTLGQLQQYEELQRIAWQLAGKVDLPEQVCQHFAQGHEALENHKQARRWQALAKMRAAKHKQQKTR